MTMPLLVPLPITSANDDIQSEGIIYSPVTALDLSPATDPNAFLLLLVILLYLLLLISMISLYLLKIFMMVNYMMILYLLMMSNLLTLLFLYALAPETNTSQLG